MKKCVPLSLHMIPVIVVVILISIPAKAQVTVNNFQLALARGEILAPDELEVGDAHFDLEVGSARIKNESTRIIVFKDTNRQNNFFNRAAKDHNVVSRVENCSLLIDAPVGVANGNHSFGAVCVISENGKTSKAMVCGDEMLGRFQTQITEKQDVATEQLAKFVIANCYGG